MIALSNGSGNALTINRYDEYGVQGPGNAGRFQYTGQAVIESGLYNYRNRAPDMIDLLQNCVLFCVLLLLVELMARAKFSYREPNGATAAERAKIPADFRWIIERHAAIKFGSAATIVITGSVLRMDEIGYVSYWTLWAACVLGIGGFATALSWRFYVLVKRK